MKSGVLNARQPATLHGATSNKEHEVEMTIRERPHHRVRFFIGPRGPPGRLTSGGGLYEGRFEAACIPRLSKNVAKIANKPCCLF